MLQRLKDFLANTPNGSADDCLLEALSRGTPAEQGPVLQLLLTRKNAPGLIGVIRQYDRLPEPLKLVVQERISVLVPVLPECGRSEDHGTRIQAMRLIALGRQGKLSYVLTENLATHQPHLEEAAATALSQLAIWVTREVRRMQSGRGDMGETVQALLEQRNEIEMAVYRALDQHGMGKSAGGQMDTLLRAALVLCDSALSRTTAILSTSRHGGVSPLVRKMQQVPDAESVDGYLLGVTHGQLRAQFANTFAAIDAPVVLDGLLRRTHWLADVRLGSAVGMVQRGAWWSLPHVEREIARLAPAQVADMARWIGMARLPDELIDECMGACYSAVVADESAAVRVVRVAVELASRPEGAGAMGISRGRAGRGVLMSAVRSPFEPVARVAMRQLGRLQRAGSGRAAADAGGEATAELNGLVLPLMQSVPESVRRVMSRTAGVPAFVQYWDRFDRLNRTTRKQAGRAMLKLLPEAVTFLQRKLHGPVEGMLRALQMAHELQVADSMGPHVRPLLRHPQPRVRSKAISVIGQQTTPPPAELVDLALADADARVRSNAIEVLERWARSDYLPLLAERSRSSHNRERANAIKALHSMKVTPVSRQLLGMLQDERPEHRISGLWAVRQLGLLELMSEVSRLAQTDENTKVRRYALAVAKGLEQPPANGQSRRAG